MIQIRHESTRVSQGDIYRDIEHIESIEENNGEIKISKILFPYAIVLTQDCDLEQDHYNRIGRNGKVPETQDKYLLSILLAPLYNLQHFIEGSHLSEIEQRMRNDIPWKKTEGKLIQNNEIPRYHFLKFGDEVEVVDSVIDFKHYFSINTQTLQIDRHNKYVFSVSELYREQISHRFSFYLSRIGLP